ncbi:MAG: InlB B-repeat-containing protein, partial [Lachnospiraceae bacterium]|nr:InlB B-repeat-containing protein [Lachnospiraceae bacterium]
MYRRLKNILGASLMILAVVMSQIPMPEAQAEETSTVTFSMNGGEFNGEYNGYNFKGQTPVLILDNNKTIDNYPDDQYASYAGYETENGKWYTDKACIEEFDQKSRISESITIYKKWYSTEEGFSLNPDRTVLYRYSGDAKLVQIPDCVTTIAPNAFEDIANVRGIVLPKDIDTVYDNAFSGASQENSIIYIYDSESSRSKEMAQRLAESYEQFVYSSYLDVDKVEEIAGIQYDAEENQAESEVGNAAENVPQTDEGNAGEAVSASEEQTETETKTEEAREYTVTFNTGISGIVGETRTVPAHSTISELVSISGEQPKALEKGSYTVETDDGKQETVYTFDGWYKDSGCTTEWDFAKDTIESDTTIYAKWDREIKPYFYVTFVADDADNVPEKVKLYEDEPVNEPSQKPVIKGKTFKGWYTDEEDSGTEFVTWGKPLSGNLTLYA